MHVTIHYDRVGKNTTTYVETRRAEDSNRLCTAVNFTPDLAQQWSQVWQQMGRMRADQLIHTVHKYYFYQHPFCIIEARDQHHALIGYYCDVSTPLQKQGPDYYLTDLFVDFWVASDGTLTELDWDEYEAAVAAGLLPPPLQSHVTQAVTHIRTAHQQGRFPAAYTDPATPPPPA